MYQVRQFASLASLRSSADNCARPYASSAADHARAWPCACARRRVHPRSRRVHLGLGAPGADRRGRASPTVRSRGPPWANGAAERARKQAIPQQTSATGQAIPCSAGQADRPCVARAIAPSTVRSRVRSHGVRVGPRKPSVSVLSPPAVLPSARRRRRGRSVPIKPTRVHFGQRRARDRPCGLRQFETRSIRARARHALVRVTFCVIGCAPL